MYVCMLPTLLKNYRTELHEIFRTICHHPRTSQLDFGSDQVKGQGPGHEKVKNIFLSYEINAKMFTFQFPILWYGDKCGVGEGVRSTEWFVCMYVCILPTFLKNYWTELHEIFRDDLSWSKDQSIRFWEWSGQRSRSRSRSRKDPKLLHQISWNFQGWSVVIQGPID